jgi:phospholipid transport system substrate-binding protein
MKNLIAAIILSFALPTAALAAVPEAAPINTLDAALITTMKSGAAHAGFQSRYDALDPVVKQVLNLPVILQNSVGFLWSTIPAGQQQQLAALFEQFTVASYVSQFNGYDGESINVLPEEKPLGAKKIVESQIVPADGSAPVRIDYVMADGDAGWQVTDILLNGTISQVAVHSSDFSALVTAGDASQLIAALKAKIATLSGGVLQN